MKTLDVNKLSYDHSEDRLIVVLDSTAYGRSYRVAWNPEAEPPLAVLSHWGDDCVESNSDLSPNEVWEIQRFLDAEDDIYDAFVELRWAMPPALEAWLRVEE